MKWENLFAYILGSIIVIVNILAPLAVWYFFFITDEYKAIVLVAAVIQTWIGYNTVKGLIGSDS